MTRIHRGIIRAYDSGTHTADVRVVSDLAQQLADVPVATDIPAVAVVANRECSVLFFQEDDPDDAVVITIHGALPPASGGDVTGPASSTDEALARFDGTGGKTLQNSNATLDDTGNLNVTAKILGEGASTPGNYLVDVGGGGVFTSRIGFHAGLGGQLAASAGTLRGVGGFAICRTAGDTLAQGLSFAAGMSGIDLTDAHAINTFGFVFGSGKTLTNYIHHNFTAVSPILATITNNYGTYHRAIPAGTNRRHIYAEDITGGTIARFIDFVNALQVRGSGEYTAAANQTPIFIYEGTTPTLRQLQWMDPGSGGANFVGGERVCILV